MIVKLDFNSETPIYIQLRNQIVIGISRGDLLQNEGLPTVRQMASDLGINNMTVNKAYNMLKNEEFISIDRRHGAKVNAVENPEKYREKLEDELTLAISEAGLKGIKRNEFFDICQNIFSTMNGINVVGEGVGQQ